MTDIVERLRETSAGGLDEYGVHCALEAEAADEIERLRHENMRLQTANDYAFGPKGELANKDREIEQLRNTIKNCPPVSESEYVRRLESEIAK